jgi:5'-nucleotidase (lipoprotein e(P4) family)
MKKIPAIITLSAAAFIFSCKSYSPKATEKTAQPSKTLENLALNGKIYSAVFQQRAAEYKALCQQAFNVASYQLDLALKQSHTKPLAIVTDIDETFLDNSPYAVAMAKKGDVYSDDTWVDWTSKASAEPLMGSQAFFNEAASKGVEVFYISNRGLRDKPGTVANLQQLGYPFADDAHIILRDKTSSKEERRHKVSERFEIVMLLGDNLSDFSAAFDKKNETERLQGVKDNAAVFGKKFIVLPNTGYGDWESALFNYSYKWTPAQKDSIYIQSVKGF